MSTSPVSTPLGLHGVPGWAPRVIRQSEGSGKEKNRPHMLMLVCAQPLGHARVCTAFGAERQVAGAVLGLPLPV